MFRYRRGEEELFGGLSYVFEPGRVTAVTGASGCGKSTLLYVLGLILSPIHGTVTLAGENVSAAVDAERSRIRAESIGFVFQDSALDSTRTILDSVIEPALYAGWRQNVAQDKGRGLLDRMGVGHRADHRPGEISGGQAQRVAVCRSLVTDPVVVLADEPTGNLDQANAEGVLAALSEAAGSGGTESGGGGRTVVIATHDPFVIDVADEVLPL
ncbi:ABC transporter ATP-binding protein [Nesterenkonia muleiensis]|uniref:ABC transporter ATP-binding protein n=1 Tax=Nesterenkonia muleiensis TaxID=2282648 RepID=UPI001EE497CA|nr:ATP-binding cassette domain-containing protein [Nesterenkonia muleiensis]